MAVTVKPPSVYVATGVPFAPARPEKVMVVGDAAAEASAPPARMTAANVAFLHLIMGSLREDCFRCRFSRLKFVRPPIVMLWQAALPSCVDHLKLSRFWRDEHCADRAGVSLRWSTKDGSAACQSITI